MALTWSAPANAAGAVLTYTVLRSQTQGGPYTVVAAGVPSTSYADVTVTPGQAYYYVVVDIANGSQSPNSNEATAVAPPVPANANILAARTMVLLTWKQVYGDSAYYVYRSVNDGPYGYIGQAWGRTSTPTRSRL
jgi:pectate lyase